jgi:hypothetical protein
MHSQQGNEMKKTSKTLTPMTNIVLIVLYGIISLFLFITIKPYPYILVSIAVILGFIAGVMQILSFDEDRESFVNISSMTEVRNKMKATKWGKRYLYFFWLTNIFFMTLIFLHKDTNPFLTFLTVYIVFALIREITTLKTTFKLQNEKQANL